MNLNKINKVIMFSKDMTFGNLNDALNNTNTNNTNTNNTNTNTTRCIFFKDLRNILIPFGIIIGISFLLLIFL